MFTTYLCRLQVSLNCKKYYDKNVKNITICILSEIYARKIEILKGEYQSSKNG